MGARDPAGGECERSWIHAALLVVAAVVGLAIFATSVPVCRHAVASVVHALLHDLPQASG